MEEHTQLLLQIFELGATGAFLIVGVYIVRMLMPVLREHLQQQREAIDNFSASIDGVTDIVQRLDMRMGIMERRLGYARRFEARVDSPGDMPQVTEESSPE